MLCEYGCGQEGKYLTSNGKFCCSKHYSICPIIRNKITKQVIGKKFKRTFIPIEIKNNNFICDYGCGNIAKYKFQNGKVCCSYSYRSCNFIKNKITGTSSPRYGIKHTDEVKIKCGIMNKGRKLTKEHKEKIIRYGKDNSSWKGGYDKNKLCRYDKYSNDLLYGEIIRKNIFDENILEAKCNYCGKWFFPTPTEAIDRIRCINGQAKYGECRFYCSNACKNECPIFNQILYPKGFKITTSREVQPELRQMRFEKDNYTCQKCNKHQSELDVGLHCHHLEGIRWEPIESSDVDKCITVCKNCHLEIHKIEGCNYNDLICKKEIEREI